MARNGLSSSPKEIPLSGFIAFLRFYSLLRRDAWKFDFMASDGGTSVCEPLAEQVRERGAKIVMAARVINLEQDRAGGWAVNYQQAGELAFINTKQIVLALDVNNCKKVLAASPDLSGSDAVYWPRAVETAIMRVWFDCQPNPVAVSGILTGDFVLHNFFWLDRIYDDYRAWSDATGGSVVEVHIYNPAELGTFRMKSC